MRHGYRPERCRPGWALAGWLVAAWQVSLGFGIGLPFAYTLAGITVIAVGAWLVRRPPFEGSASEAARRTESQNCWGSRWSRSTAT